jgi:hypothetical protein
VIIVSAIARPFVWLAAFFSPLPVFVLLHLVFAPDSRPQHMVDATMTLMTLMLATCLVGALLFSVCIAFRAFPGRIRLREHRLGVAITGAPVAVVLLVAWPELASAVASGSALVPVTAMLTYLYLMNLLWWNMADAAKGTVRTDFLDVDALAKQSRKAEGVRASGQLSEIVPAAGEGNVSIPVRDGALTKVRE